MPTEKLVSPDRPKLPTRPVLSKEPTVVDEQSLTERPVLPDRPTLPGRPTLPSRPALPSRSTLPDTPTEPDRPMTGRARSTNPTGSTQAIVAAETNCSLGQTILAAKSRTFRQAITRTSEQTITTSEAITTTEAIITREAVIATKTDSSTETPSSVDFHDIIIVVLIRQRSRAVTTAEFSGEKLDLRNVDFSVMDDHARACPLEEEESIERLSWYLTSPFHGDQVAQLRSIFAWMAANMTYDMNSFLNPSQRKSQDAGNVLKTKLGVCAGFANLFDALAAPARLDVRIVIGLARGVGIEVGGPSLGGGHAWNVVNVNGEELLIDSTWGSGSTDDKNVYHRQLNPFYFLQSPKRMIYTHLSEQPHEQFLDPPIANDTFARLPFRRAHSWLMGIKPSLNDSSSMIRAKDDYFELEIRFKKQGNLRNHEGSKRALCHQWMVWQGYPEKITPACHWTREEGKYTILTIKSFCPGPGSGQLTIGGLYTSSDHNGQPKMAAVGDALQYQIVNEGMGANWRPMMTLASAGGGFSASILEPMTAEVPRGQALRVRVRVYDVEEGERPSLIVMRAGSMPDSLREVAPSVYEVTISSAKAGQYVVGIRVGLSCQGLGQFQVV
ncbi:hypothetical protein BGZ94_010044 [Podila epigama]|nr:hypothetical protein BGZ94_010044 [Podila epigama]